MSPEFQNFVSGQTVWVTVANPYENEEEKYIDGINTDLDLAMEHSHIPGETWQEVNNEWDNTLEVPDHRIIYSMELP